MKTSITLALLLVSVVVSCSQQTTQTQPKQPVMASDTTGAFIWFVVWILRIGFITCALPAVISLIVYAKSTQRLPRRKIGIVLAIVSILIGLFGILYLLMVTTTTPALDFSVVFT